MKNVIITIFLMLVALATCARGAELLVLTQYPTIQSAIDAAVNGDTVIVAPGTYYENINFKCKNITLTSTNPEDPNIVATTVIDGNNSGSVVIFAGTETADCLLTGFTITGGHSTRLGGGISGNGTQATINRCVITKNIADTQGGGLEYVNGIISRCIITHNSASIGGGMARCPHEGNCTISNCLISYNYSPYEGGGIARSGNASITNCTIVYNNGQNGYGLSDCGGPITNCIIWGNSLSYCSTPTYSCVRGYDSGAGNINTDPQFADPNNDDYHLQSISPCIDAGTNLWPDWMYARDIDGKIRQIDGNNDGVFVADMGAYEYGTVETPLIAIRPAAISFISIIGGDNPANQTLSIWNIGSDTLNWQVTESCSWLEASPKSRSSQGEIEEVALMVNSSGLSTGSYTCNLIVSHNGANKNTITIPITLVVYPEDEIDVPFKFLTIQDAIDNADEGDIITVAYGTYTGLGNRDIDFKGKAITVRSADPNNPNVVAGTVIDCENNARGFYFHNNESADSILNGFTITRSYAQYDGGITCDRSSPTITNCIITNSRRRGIYCWDGNPTITNCTINSSAREGIVCSTNGIFTISDCKIFDNKYVGIRCISSECGPSGTIIISNCIVKDNYSEGYGSGIRLERIAAAKVSNCIITGNSTLGGWSNGGSISCIGSNVTVDNCLISGNKSDYSGGGIYIRDYSTLTISDCTIADNSANVGGGIYCYWGCDLSVYNTVLWGNKASEGSQIYLRDKCDITVSFSDIEGSSEGIYVEPQGPGEVIWLNGNIDADPCFVDAANGDYHLKSEGWRWDSKRSRWTYDDVTSRCIDAGNPGSPLGDELLSVPDDPNNIWGQNLRIDMGAFGGTAEASIPPYDWALLADLTNDGLVDLADYAYQAADWLDSADQQPGDLNRDSLVDISDLALLVEDWLGQTTWHE